MSHPALCETPAEIPCTGPGGELRVLTLDHLLDARLCRRLPWWRAQGFVPAPPRPEADLPLPWPKLPPGWRGSGRGWARTFLDAPPEWGVGARADWIVEQDGRPHLVLLGLPTPSLRLRARLLGALVALRGNPDPGLGWQGFPKGGLSGTWLGEWPSVQPLRLPLFTSAQLATPLVTLRQDLELPWPPNRTAPRSRCWDCPASRLCGDFC